MKKLIILITLLLCSLGLWAQSTLYSNLSIQKAAPVLYLNGTGAIIDFYNGDIRFTQSSNLLTLSGGDFSLGSNSLLMTGSLGTTGSRLLKGWMTNIEITNLPTINGGTLAAALSLSSYLLKADTTAMLIPYALISEINNAGAGVYVEIPDTTGHAVGNYMPRNSTEDLVNDSIAARIAAATVGVALADSNVYVSGYATLTFVDSRLGSGSGLSAERLPFIIGHTTGAPTTADSTITHTSFAGKHIDLYRDGAKQYQNFTATNTVEGFRLNSSTITVYPLWQDNEQILVDIIEPILWSYLSIEGEESSLLADLSGYWNLDEPSGNVVNDATGTQYGYTTATIAQAAKIGYGNDFDAAADGIDITYNTNISPKGAAFSVSLWFKIDVLPSTAVRDNYLFRQNNTASPWGPHQIIVDDANDKIVFTTTNTSGTAYSVTSTSAISTGLWYHVVAVNRGNGQTLQLYVNGADVSATAGTFTGTLYEGLNSTSFGNAYQGGSVFLNGMLDELAIFHVALSTGNVTTLYNLSNGKTYPFN
jgi:hypothetical protein